MALCRFEAKIISRSGGRSTVGAASYRSGKCATSAAAYRAGAELKDERTGTVYDYTRKRGVEGAEVMLPAGAPAWMRERGQLWNAVEKAEKRADAQLARDYILTLPHELDPDRRRELTRQFVRGQFVDKGYAADIAWHTPHGKGDERNHHAHVMVVMRRVEGDGFARTKERPPEGKHPAEHWKAELRACRESWANAGADALEQAGFTLEAIRFRAGHLTLDKQRDAAIARGDLAWAETLDRETEPKQGPLATKIEQQGRESHAGNDRREVQARNAARIALKAEQTAVEAEIIDLQVERAKRGLSAAPEPSSRRQAPEATGGATTNGTTQATPAGDTTSHDAGQQGRSRMDPLNDRSFAQQVKREVEQLQVMQEAEACIAAWKRARDEEAAEAKAREQQGKEATERQATYTQTGAGEIADADTRYSQALGRNYNVKDPYSSLARAAMEEWSTFKKEQDTLRKDAANEPEAEKRRLIDMRREIEGHEYMSITSQRLAGMAEQIGGRRDHPSAEQYRDQAAEHRQRAEELREQRAEAYRLQQQQHEQQEAERAKTAEQERTAQTPARTNDQVTDTRPHQPTGNLRSNGPSAAEEAAWERSRAHIVPEQARPQQPQNPTPQPQQPRDQDGDTRRAAQHDRRQEDEAQAADKKKRETVAASAKDPASQERTAAPTSDAAAARRDEMRAAFAAEAGRGGNGASPGRTGGGRGR